MDTTLRLNLFRFCFTLFLINSFIIKVVAQEKKVTLTGKILNQSNNKPLEDIFISVLGGNEPQLSDKSGGFTLNLLSGKKYTLEFRGININTEVKYVFLEKDTAVTYRFKENIESLSEVTILGKVDKFGIRQLRAVEDGGIYEGKKSEVINIKNITANKATNNARQAFAKIPSLNVWESDFAGLQLDIGGRGLDPKRTSNFNTRQNGYDISADALGYPESYYTPPLQAVKQIQLVRGSGALQYGSQFGGMINFKMKDGDTEKPLNFETENTYGAYNFFNTFNSLHGQYKKLNHYTYVQYKSGDGWRPNSNFNQFGAYTNLKFEPNDRLKIGFEYTYMNYLSQQAGGLTDEQFLEDPQQSTRSRNWFKVKWNVPAISLTYEIRPDIKFYHKSFALIAQRTSLGLLSTPNEEDIETSEIPYENRDLIDGKFENFGNETRLVINYETGKSLRNTILLGSRVFKGFTNFSQDIGTNGIDANFTKVDTLLAGKRKSDFKFPSINYAVFVEKIIRLNKSLSLIPGVRLEHISTTSEGKLIEPVETSSFGDVIEQDSIVNISKKRNIILYGLGLSKKLNKKFELYANATSNYRAINFTDVAISTRTQFVDPFIEDEKGYNFDIGLRKRDFTPYFLEASLFYTIYNNRIGNILDDGLRIRTNIGDGNIFGAELFFEVDLLKAFITNIKKQKFNWFINGSVNHGVYTEINDRAIGGVITGNKIENIPDYNVKTGLLYGLDKFKTSVQGTFVGSQFSDAENSDPQIDPSLGSTTGVIGEIPSYMVVDVSSEYEFSDKVTLSGSINNLLNRAYFTRRATGYPGPGIIPAQGITWVTTLKIKI